MYTRIHHVTFALLFVFQYTNATITLGGDRSSSIRAYMNATIGHVNELNPESLVTLDIRRELTKIANSLSQILTSNHGLDDRSVLASALTSLHSIYPLLIGTSTHERVKSMIELLDEMITGCDATTRNSMLGTKYTERKQN